MGVMHPVTYSESSALGPGIHSTYVTYWKVVRGKITPLFGGRFLNVLEPATWGKQ
jgi:hypothetical protein